MLYEEELVMPGKYMEYETDKYKKNKRKLEKDKHVINKTTTENEKTLKM